MRAPTLLSTAAAVLLIGAGTANAQSAKDQAAPERAPAAQRSAPAEKMAPSMNAGEHKTPAETTGQGSSESKSGAAMDKSGTTGAASKSESDRDTKSGKSANDKSDMNKKSADQDKSKGGTAAGMKNEDNTKSSASESRKGAASGGAGTESKSSTTGQGAAGAAKLSTQQRTKITTIIKQQNVQPTHLNISVRVGTRVPESVHFYPVPTQVIEVYPEWRGYDYILVAGDILILDPDTHEIVAIIAA